MSKYKSIYVVRTTLPRWGRRGSRLRVCVCVWGGSFRRRETALLRIVEMFASDKKPKSSSLDTLPQQLSLPPPPSVLFSERISPCPVDLRGEGEGETQHARHTVDGLSFNQSFFSSRFFFVYVCLWEVFLFYPPFFF